jgi:large subunit ribosomal protein L32
VACSNKACREPKPQHIACPTCGQYDGRQVTQPA